VIRVLIAEDHPVVRTGLEQLLRATEDMEIAGVAEDGAQAVALAAESKPDVVLMDLVMPSLDGVGATQKIVAANPDARVVVLTSFADRKRILAALGGGAVGYLLKDRVSNVADFLDSVRRVAAGGTAMDPEVIGQLLARNTRNEPINRLTPRESEVLGLMAEGRSNAAIASALFVTEKAVSKHTNNIFAKLDLPPSEDDNRRVMAVLTYLSAR
jgi:DNA-binding NarL/FixJ family response regulator